MKSLKKKIKIIFFLLFAVAFFWSLIYYLKAIYRVEGEAKLVEMNLPGETQNIKFGIDAVTTEKLKWKDALLIKGWVFIDHVREEKREVYLVLRSKNSTLIFDIEKDKLNRPDVTNYYHMNGGIDNHGFELSFPLYHLKEQSYQIGFVILDETGKYYMISSKELLISGEGVKVDGFKSELDEKLRSKQVSIELKVPTHKINNNFESISVSGNNLTISGWGFLEGMNTDFQKSFIVLKKNETVTVFSVVAQKRKDVTDYFKNSGLNLDSSGFIFQIAERNLENGRYQVGLYIVKGNETGMVYSDKLVDIGK